MGTILGNLKTLWRSLVKKEAVEEDIGGVFRFKYGLFKELLNSNTQLLNIITDMEEKLKGHQLFGMSYIRANASRAVFHAFRMVKSLDVLSGHRYSQLYPVLEEIHQKIKAELETKREGTAAALVLPYAAIFKEMVDVVGGKNAHLGEAQNRLQLPVPLGFAITTNAYDAFLAHNDLVEEINKRKLAIDINDVESIRQTSEEIQALIIAAQMPPALEQAILEAYEDMARQLGRGEALRVSLRSSAIGEDSDLSYAGQYLTALNVTADRLLSTYKTIVASLYTPQAISYRLVKGIRDEDTAMSVACLQMVDAKASGVMYSRHPVRILEDNIIINAVWGLGPYVVEGILTPDTYIVAKDADFTILSTQVMPKPVQLVNNPTGGVEERPVPPENQEAPCLTPEQMQTLASYALQLEKHYGVPQDIEWALDQEDRLLILQSRPLRLKKPTAGDVQAIPRLEGYPLLVEGGAVACAGVGCGPAYYVRDLADLKDFPDGGVLVANHSSPQFVIVMGRAAGIVADHGSVSGHMAALTREFGVPTILGAEGASKAIAPGTEVTVDAYSGRVYQGRVRELLELQQPRETHMQGTPVYQTLRRVADLVIPLNLVDPQAPTFTAENCQTLHDISRFVHENSYKVMFQVSDLVSYEKGGAVKLTAPIPLDLYIVDLGEGLRDRDPRETTVTVANIASVPFQALLQGMLHPDLQGIEPRPIHVSGLLAVMREQMLAPVGDRFGDRSYAVISGKYLNFSSRVGYHYSVLDAYCGNTINNNYITFSFKGGAADDVRRNRRVRAIARVLEHYDFAVAVKGDQVQARFLKYPCPVIAEKLEMIGRLLLFTRQMDMLMNSEYSVELVVQNFLAGNYRLDRLSLGQREPEPSESTEVPSTEVRRE